MTGFRCDAKVNEFIKSVDGFVLRKPFRLQELVDFHVRCKSRSALEADPAGAVVSGVSELSDSFPKVETPCPQAAGIGVPRLAPLAVPTLLPPIAVSADTSSLRRRLGKSAGAFAAVSLLILSAAVLGFWCLAARQRADAAVAELVARDAEWMAISAKLPAISNQRQSLRQELGQPARIAADRERPRWTPPLREIAMAAGEGIELQKLLARAGTEDSGDCEVRLHGLVDGPQPRMMAEHFRSAVENGVRKDAKDRPVSVRFEQLEDEPEPSAAASDQRRAAFVILATVGPVHAPVPLAREGR